MGSTKTLRLKSRGSEETIPNWTNNGLQAVIKFRTSQLTGVGRGGRGGGKQLHKENLLKKSDG